MYDVIVIGAGPAGMMASIIASQNGKVLLLEKNEKLGKKLELTGGGRCNLTNLKSVDNFIKEIPVNNKFLYSSLTTFGPQDIYNYFNSLGVYLKIEDNDRVFPVSNKSKTIIEALEKELIKNKVNIHLNENVKSIESGEIKKVITDKFIYECKRLIVSTGGYSYPNTGSTGDGYLFAKSINQNITELYPAETYLITKDFLPLTGITLENIKVRINNKEQEGSLLFTHIGLSGPAVFKISEEVFKSLKNEKVVTLNIDLIPNISEKYLLDKLNKYNQKKEISSFVREYLPRRFSDYILKDIQNLKIGFLQKIKKEEIILMLKNFQIDIKGTGSIDKSFVTGGGIDIKNVNPKTMESTINKGVYFIGELLDLHGHTGGYNITIALATGYAAGLDCKNQIIN